MNMNDPIASLLGSWATELNLYSVLLRVAVSVVFAAMIGCGEVDMLLFFRDPVGAKPGEPNDMMLLRLCDMHTIPVATNIATAEVLIHGLERGDLAWIELQRGRK